MECSPLLKYLPLLVLSSIFMSYFYAQDPKEIVLGEEVINAGTGGPFKIKKHSFQYVSIIKVLEQLLNQVDMF